MKKEELYETLLRQLEGRYAEMQQGWYSLMESNQQEGKSSAGDKHETAGAMVHLELEQLGRQIEETKRHIAEVGKWKPSTDSNDEFVVMGSLVDTTKGLFYMITGLGKLEMDGRLVFVIGPSSPMGKALLGKKIGERFEFGQLDGIVTSIS